MSLKLDLSKVRTHSTTSLTPKTPINHDLSKISARRSIIEDYSNRNRDMMNRYSLNSPLSTDRPLPSTPPHRTRHLSLAANVFDEKNSLAALHKMIDTYGEVQEDGKRLNTFRAGSGGDTFRDNSKAQLSRNGTQSVFVKQTPRPKSPSPAERSRGASPAKRRSSTPRKKSVHRLAPELYEDVRTETPRRGEDSPYVDQIVPESNTDTAKSVASRRDEIAAYRQFNQVRLPRRAPHFGSVPRDVAKPNPIEKLFDVSFKDLHVVKLKSPRDILPPSFNSREMTFYRIGRLPPPTRAAYGSIPRHVINSKVLSQYDHMKVNKKKAQVDLLRREREQDELDRMRKNQRDALSLNEISILRMQGYFLMTSREICGVENYMYQTEARFSPKCIYDAFIQDKKIAKHWHQQEDHELLFDKNLKED